MWISKGEYQRLVRDRLRAERRADDLFAALTAERAANRTSERHWANMFLRSKAIGAFPQPREEPKTPAPELEPANPDTLIPGMDDGEVEAVVATGQSYGVSREETLRLLKQQRGLQ